MQTEPLVAVYQRTSLVILLLVPSPECIWLRVNVWLRGKLSHHHIALRFWNLHHDWFCYLLCFTLINSLHPLLGHWMASFLLALDSMQSQIWAQSWSGLLCLHTRTWLEVSSIMIQAWSRAAGVRAVYIWNHWEIFHLVGSQYCRWGWSGDGMSSLPLLSESTDPSDTAGNIAIISRSSGRPHGNAVIAGNLVAHKDPHVTKWKQEQKVNQAEHAQKTKECLPFLEWDGSRTRWRTFLRWCIDISHALVWVYEVLCRGYTAGLDNTFS